jgi:hypothetical protein
VWVTVSVAEAVKPIRLRANAARANLVVRMTFLFEDANVPQVHFQSKQYFSPVLGERPLLRDRVFDRSFQSTNGPCVIS